MEKRVEHFFEPAYILDYRTTPNCARLATLIRDKSGEKRTMEVQVFPGSEPKAKPILATATSDPAKKKLDIIVTTKAGQQDFVAYYDAVLSGMSQAHPDRSW